MKYFEKNRRRLMKKHYIRGTQKSVFGTGSVQIENSAGVPIKMLEIAGKTVQAGTPTKEAPIPIQNSNDNGASIVVHGENLATAQEVYNKTKIVEIGGRACVEASGYYGYVIPDGFKEKTQYTVSFDVSTKLNPNATNTGAPMAFYVKYKGLETSWNSTSHVIVVREPSEEFQRVSLTTLANQTIVSIGAWTNTNKYFVYVDIDSFMFQEGAVIAPAYKPYCRETIEIPTSIDVSGTNVPLLFSEYDKLTVDSASGKVTYLNGSFLKTLNGNEPMGSETTSGLVWITLPFELTGKVYSNQFVKNTDFVISNSLGLGSSGIAFPFSEFAGISSLSTYLKEQYDNGTPVIFLLERKNPLEYDITDTELGQALLSLCVPKGESGTLKAVSDIGVSELNATYYSETEEDTVKLTIKYVTENFNEVAKEKEHNVRKGSKYLITAPHIEGYKRISSEVYGVADEATIIELIYKEDNDAGV